MDEVSGARPNRLLMGLVVISLLIHALVFMKVAGLYRSQPRPAIELTLRDVSRPPARKIPRAPAVGPAPGVHAEDISPVKVPPIPVPLTNPAAPAPTAPLSVESAAPEAPLPDAPRIEKLPVAVWRPPPARPAPPPAAVPAPPSSERAPKDAAAYLEEVRRKIQGMRQYPRAAVRRRIEGRAVVRFVIGLDGNVRDLSIQESSGSGMLDRAALEAVRRASPFRKPPPGLFTKPPSIVLPVAFRLERG
ncbi:MAG: energy transducer TonB [Deltaproteobacteria bacterium]|nr:energy transducer TonB [Deltaproteobacteria bacterium]MBW1949649.1 energy transducer TonB [Deltaproteobacteria bacterium]MBW2346673.1 energy transducer TonB [Deltaproteobacteria bacterium]RLB38030.1 MAG: hypothetical protein DRH20_06610 [Deltaproteobacteria bacterium]